MDLFNNEDSPNGTEGNQTPPKKRIKSRGLFNPLKQITDKFNQFEQFELALQLRDREALMVLLSDWTDSYYWKSKEEFIDKYLKTCDRFERKAPIFVTVFKGNCLADTDGVHNLCRAGKHYGIAVAVNSVYNNLRIWRFNLLCSIDWKWKIVIKRCTCFEVDVNELP